MYLFCILVYKIGSRSEFPTSNTMTSDNNYAASNKNYNDPKKEDPMVFPDSTTVLLSGVSNIALNGTWIVFKYYASLLFPTNYYYWPWSTIVYVISPISYFDVYLGGQGKLPAPQTLGGTNGKKTSEKSGILFGRSDSFGKDEHLGKWSLIKSLG